MAASSVKEPSGLFSSTHTKTMKITTTISGVAPPMIVETRSTSNKPTRAMMIVRPRVPSQG